MASIAFATAVAGDLDDLVARRKLVLAPYSVTQHSNATMKKFLTVLLASLLATFAFSQTTPGKTPTSAPKAAKQQATAAKKKPVRKKAATAAHAAGKKPGAAQTAKANQPKPKTKATTEAKPKSKKATTKKAGA